MARRTNRLLLTAVVLVATPGLVWAQGGASSTGSQPPFDLTDASVVQAGSRLFRANCTHYCHSPDGRAGSSARPTGTQ
jgi:mono/diheme cytochrome c family protein